MFHYLITRDLAVGDHVPGEVNDLSVSAAGHPRGTALRAFNLHDQPRYSRLGSLAELSADTELRLAQLAPEGPVECAEVGEAPWRCAAGWRVSALLPLATVFGPHGQELLELAAEVEHRLREDRDGRRSYRDWLGKQQPWSLSPPSRYAQARSAALRALQECVRHGGGECDLEWWHEHAVRGERADELLALATRDLVETVPGWDSEAYAALTLPWRYAFGPVHTGDALPCRYPGGAPVPAPPPASEADTAPTGGEFYLLAPKEAQVGQILHERTAVPDPARAWECDDGWKITTTAGPDGRQRP